MADYDGRGARDHRFRDTFLGTLAGALAGTVIYVVLFTPGRDGLTNAERLYRSFLRRRGYEPNRKDI